MAELWKSEDVASQISQEEGRSSLSSTLFECSVTSSSANMAPLALIEQPKRENRKLPTQSLMAMTCGVGGLQVLWSTIFSHGSSYLFSLGISKTQSSLIWAVAPICGSIVQPILGVISDRSRISWGRRRPFILGGVVTTVLAALILAWAGPISTAFCILFDIRDIDGTRATVTQFTAILSVILLNISIQPLQLGLRSLNIDVCPREQQSIASAWASRFAGIGNIFGYVLGSLPLPWISSDYEAIRFRYMVQCTIVALIATSFISCYYTEEENPKLSEYDPEFERPVYRIFQYMIEGFSKTSQRVRRVYLVQFFSWFGWFGFLFYSTSCISQLYVEEQAKNNVTISSTLKDHGMRIGAMANLMFAIVALATNIVLPLLSTTAKSMASRTKNQDWETLQLFSQLPFIWGFGQLVYVVCVLSMVMVSSSTTGTFMIAIAGLSWGITQWVPFAIIGEETARHQINDGSIQREDGGVWSVVQGGRIMGMHNAAISIPQIIAALFSSAIFWIAQKLGRENAIVWVIGWSGLPGAIAAWLAFIM